jgi:pimeloyl-ACP methyl ester carboxylesterase
VIHKLSFIGGFGWKVYHDIIQWGLDHVSSSSRPFYVFPYDWRRDLTEVSQEYEAFLKEIYERHKKPIQVVAHSMGGVITMSVVNRSPELFHSILFAGVPFRTGIGYIRDLTEGSSLGFNESAFPPETVFSFGSSFWTFPTEDEPANYHSGMFEYHPELAWEKSKVGQDFSSVPFKYMLSTSSVPKPDHPPKVWELKKTPIDYYNADHWVKYKLGVFANPLPPEEEKVYLQHLRYSLARGKSFRESLKYNPNVNYPPISVISAKNYPTSVTVVRNGPKANKGLDFDSAPLVDGDGRIPFDCSFPDSRISHSAHLSELHHGDLLNDVSFIRTRLAELLSKD